MRIAGLDYLRCGASMAVVAIHCDLFTGFSNVIRLNVLMLAVPLFLLMALYLFNSNPRFKERATRLVWLTLFWVAIWSAYFGATVFDAVRQGDVWEVFQWAITGGHGVFYFFVTLLFLTCVVYASRHLPKKVLWGFLAISLIIIPFLPMQHFPGFQTVFLVFLPLAFISLLIRPVKLWIILFLAGLSLEMALVEWILGWDAVYARLSVSGFATVIFLLSLRIKGEPPKVIRVIADCSLGIYCLHFFLIDLYQRGLGVPVSFSQHLIEFCVIFLVSLIGVLFLKRALQYRMV